MGAKKIQYNLSGHGQLLLYVYPYTDRLYSILRKYNYDAKFHQTNQLGSLNRVLPGAHYTRYEYIIMQWYLIHELKERGVDTGLASNGSFLQTLVENVDLPSGKLTGGDFLQCIASLSNMGHFPDTFSASRLWLHFLKKKDNNLVDGFKIGLSSSEKVLLKTILQENDIYKIHHINSLFLLNRHKNVESDKQIIEFASSILQEYITRSEEELDKYFKMYDIIRNLAYLILDSSYAPIPFNIDLSTVTSSMQQIFGRHIGSDNVLYRAIKQFDVVMQDSVYLSGNCLIASSIRSNEIEDSFLKIGRLQNERYGTPFYDEYHKISTIRDILEPINKKSNSLSKIFNSYGNFETPKIDWDTENCMSIKFSNIQHVKEVFNKEYYLWEKELHKKCGKSSCRISVFGNPNFSLFQLQLCYGM